LRDKVIFHAVGIQRPINLLADMISILKILLILRREKPDIIHTLSPKAGLLGILAGFIASVPIRIHWFTGQVWVTRNEPLHTILRFVDQIIVQLATNVLVDSESQRKFLAQSRVADVADMEVLGCGSVSGVDSTRFHPCLVSRKSVRAKLRIDLDDTVLVFLGRITPEKGLIELAEAIQGLRNELPKLHSILIGFEEKNFSKHLIRAAGVAADRLHLVGYTANPEQYLAAADFMVLPSYREGFGSSIIEAAACGIPAIGTRITGLSDSIVEGRTGLLVPTKDTKSLASAIRLLTTDIPLRNRLGEAARYRAEQKFETQSLVRLLQDYYTYILDHMK